MKKFFMALGLIVFLSSPIFAEEGNEADPIIINQELNFPGIFCRDIQATDEVFEYAFSQESLFVQLTIFSMDENCVWNELFILPVKIIKTYKVGEDIFTLVKSRVSGSGIVVYFVTTRPVSYPKQEIS